MSDQFTEEMGKQLIRIGKEKGITVTFWSQSEKYVYTANKEKVCPWIFGRAYISGDMKIIPCCTICDENTFNLGDATSFRMEWNNKKFKNLRKAHLTGNIPSMCKMCYE